MKVGMKFTSFDALNAAVEAYSKEKKVFFYIRDCRTFQSAIKRAKRIENANPDLKYYALTYKCMFAGRCFAKKKTREGAKPRNSKPKVHPSGCDAHIKVLLSRCSKYLQIVSINEEHNHPISEVMFAHHIRSRRLTGEDREKVKKYLFLMANKKLLRDQIRRETGKLITMKDLHNLSAKTKREKSFAMGLADKSPSAEVTVESHQPGTSREIPSTETMSAIEVLNMIGQETLLVSANPQIQEGGCETIVVQPDHMNSEISASLMQNNNNDSTSFETGMDYYTEDFPPPSVEQTTMSDPPVQELGTALTPQPCNNKKITTQPMVHRFCGRPRPIWSCHAIEEAEERTKSALNFDSLKEELSEHTKIMQRQCIALETMSASLQSLVLLLKKEQ